MLLTTALRDCLNQLGNDCEATKQFPDVSFGSTSVNITIRPQDDGPDAPLATSIALLPDRSMPALVDLAWTYVDSGVALVCWCWTLLLSELRTNLSKAASTGLSLISGDSHDSDIGDGLVTAGRQQTYVEAYLSG